jgi:competence protein ComEA
MLKKVLAVVAMLSVAVCFAAVDVNKGTAAELDGVKGIGPAISARIVEERKKGNFKDWNDLITRVKGIGDKNAAKFSEAGLTVNNATFTGAAPAADKKKDKPASTKAAGAPAAAPAAGVNPATAVAKDDKKDSKAEAKAKAAADKKAKAEEKAKKAEEAKAKKEADKKAKAEAKAKADAEKKAKAEEKAKAGAAK